MRIHNPWRPRFFILSPLRAAAGRHLPRTKPLQIGAGLGIKVRLSRRGFVVPTSPSCRNAVGPPRQPPGTPCPGSALGGRIGASLRHKRLDGMFRLRVLGGFALERLSGAAAPAMPKRRAGAVLAVLAVCGDLGCTRERLLALLWPENDEASARYGLRDAIYAIRRALGSGAVPSRSWRLTLGVFGRTSISSRTERSSP